MSAILNKIFPNFVQDHYITLALFLVVIGMIVLYYKILWKLNKEIKILKEKLDATKRKPTRDIDGWVPLCNAIKYIQDETDFGVQKTYDEILAELFRLAAGSTIMIRGYNKFSLTKVVDSFDSDVPADLLKSCVYINYGEFKKPALVEQFDESVKKIPVLGMPFTPPPRIFYNPQVLMSKIKHHFGMPIDKGK